MGNRSEQSSKQAPISFVLNREFSQLDEDLVAAGPVDQQVDLVDVLVLTFEPALASYDGLLEFLPVSFNVHRNVSSFFRVLIEPIGTLA